jgi:hypothetical protein
VAGAGAPPTAPAAASPPSSTTVVVVVSTAPPSPPLCWMVTVSVREVTADASPPPEDDISVFTMRVVTIRVEDVMVRDDSRVRPVSVCCSDFVSLGEGE